MAFSAGWLRTCSLWLFGLAIGWLGLTPQGTLGGEPPAEPIQHIEAGVHGVQIKRIAVDRAGRWLATASEDKTVRLWDLESGRLERVLRPPQGDGDESKLYAVAISPDGEWIAAGGWDDQGAIYLFRRATGELVRQLTGLPGTATELSWSPDGHFLAAGLNGKNGIRVFRADNFTLVDEDRNYGADVSGLDFAADGLLAAASLDGDLRLYRVELTSWPAADWDGDVRLMHVGPEKLKRRARQPAGGLPLSIRFSPDGGRLAVGFYDSAKVAVLAAYDLSHLFFADTADVTQGSLHSVAWGADGSLYAGGKYDNGKGSPIRHWLKDGRGAPTDLAAAANAVIDLQALSGGGVVFGAADPAWGIIDASGQRTRFVVDAEDLDAPIQAAERTMPCATHPSDNNH